MAKRWYVVCENRVWRGETEQERREATCWTVSLDPKRCGWNTADGVTGYGLTFAAAKELADAANLLAMAE